MSNIVCGPAQDRPLRSVYNLKDLNFNLSNLLKKNMNVKGTPAHPTNPVDRCAEKWHNDKYSSVSVLNAAFIIVSVMVCMCFSLALVLSIAVITRTLLILPLEESGEIGSRGKACLLGYLVNAEVAIPEKTSSFL